MLEHQNESICDQMEILEHFEFVPRGWSRLEVSSRLAVNTFAIGVWSSIRAMVGRSARRLQFFAVSMLSR